MTEELKRCPFCNGKAELFGGFDGLYQVICTKCNGTIDALSDKKEEVVAAWNTRPIEEENKRLREALAFYAHGKHLWDTDQRDSACEAYDRVSGQVENGHFAREVLEEL